MIDVVEDAIIAKVKSLVGDKLRMIDTLPAALDAQEMKDRLRNGPGIFVAFIGGTPRGENALCLDAQFGVFVMASGAVEKPRRRAAEALLLAVVPHLHGLVVEGAGSLTCTDVNNLFNEQLDGMGISLYGAVFKLPLTLERLDSDTLADLLEVSLQWMAPPHAPPPAGTPLPFAGADAGDDIALPAA
jgi:phage gp37-like protein